MNTQSRAVGAIARCGFGILVAGYVACAGGDTPPVDDAFRDGLRDNFGGAAGSQMASAGASGSGGSGSGNGGTGNGGSSNAAGGAAGSSGSGGSAPVGGSGPGPGLGNACDAYRTIFLVQCSGSSCHSEGTQNGVFAGDQPPAAGALVDVTSRNGEECGVLVDPDNIEDSVILQMLRGDQGGACSPVPMPIGEDALDDDELDCVTEYLTALAN
jgi:predicted CxxxxCH...CXXCH cytochrome family protein